MIKLSVNIKVFYPASFETVASENSRTFGSFSDRMELSVSQAFNSVPFKLGRGDGEDVSLERFRLGLKFKTFSKVLIMLTAT